MRTSVTSAGYKDSPPASHKDAHFVQYPVGKKKIMRFFFSIARRFWVASLGEMGT
jgi:hypothetical protein